MHNVLEYEIEIRWGEDLRGLDREWEKTEREYKKKYGKEIAQKMQDFVSEESASNPDWVKERRIEYLKEQIDIFSDGVIQAYRNYEDSRNENSPYWLRRAFLLIAAPEKKERVIERHKAELRALQYSGEIRKGKIDEFMIQRARDYPIENLIDVGRNKMALCPFHDDKTPSMYVKNNFGYCFSCQKHADTIELCMQTKGFNFVEAVKYLQG
jgi:hypothetical protein